MLAEKQQMEARVRAQARLIAKKADTRRKILLGAFVLSRLERDNSTIDVRTLAIDGAHFASWLTRPEDRALFLPDCAISPMSGQLRPAADNPAIESAVPVPKPVSADNEL